jgi:hypothetical protein
VLTDIERINKTINEFPSVSEYSASALKVQGQNMGHTFGVLVDKGNFIRENHIITISQSRKKGSLYFSYVIRPNDSALEAGITSVGVNFIVNVADKNNYTIVSGSSNSTISENTLIALAKRMLETVSP